MDIGQESRRARTNAIAGTLLAGSLSAGIGLVLAGCSEAPAQQAPAAFPVTVAAAIERPVVEWDEFSGRIEAVETVEVRPRVPGYLQSVHFAEGREVRKGELLFVIDPRPYEAALARAEAELRNAQATASLAAQDKARAVRLLESRAISREEYDRRTTALEQGAASVAAAEAAVRAARLDLQYTRVTAPIDGRVGRAEVTPGNLVAAGPTGGTRLTTLVSMDPVHVWFEGDERVYLKYTDMALRGERPSSRVAANPVRVGLANEDGYPHAGRMDFVDNRVDPASGTIRARAVLDNHDRRFTPGLYARVQLLGSGTHPAVLVDDRAIGTDQDKRFVYVVGADNVVKYRAVKPGRLVDGLRVVADGLAPGETIVVNGVQRVRPGAVVQPQRVAMDARMKAAPGTDGPRLAQR
jgi:RND family efflux transporter MFP subunit